MLVATFGPSTAWQGREIIWDVDHFILVGHGAIPAAGLLDYDRSGQLLWARPDYRAWVAEVDRWEYRRRRSPAFGAAAGGAPGTGPDGRGPAVSPWAIVLLVVRGALLIGSIVVASLVPSFLMRTTENLARDALVQAGVRTSRRASRPTPRSTVAPTRCRAR